MKQDVIGTESHPVLFLPAALIYSEAWLCADGVYEARLAPTGAPGRPSCAGETYHLSEDLSGADKTEQTEQIDTTGAVVTS